MERYLYGRQFIENLMLCKIVQNNMFSLGDK